MTDFAQPPSVSLLMGTNTCDEFFASALASCLAQTYTNFELVIVANGVSDDTFENLQALCIDPRIRLFRTAMRHLQFSLNYGLHECGADLIARMDADDVAYPERISRQVAFMQQNADISICGSFCDLIDRSGTIVGKRDYPVADRDIRKALYRDNPMCHPSVMYRRATILNAGGYQGYARAEDYYLWASLSVDPKIKFANIPERLIAYRTDFDQHPRIKARRQARASVAATQLQLLLYTGDAKWLPGVLRNIKKTVSLAFRNRLK